METQTAVQTQLERTPEASPFAIKAFEHAQRVAKMLASSSLIPKEYQGNIQNVLIAMEFANRIGASVFMVMQNLNIIQGRPSWGSSFIIAALNSCKKFSPLRFELKGEGDKMECYAWAYELNSKEKIVGPTVTMAMATAEGWLTKNGSKWKTMPTLMIRYRAAAFFGRLYAPEILMGMQTSEEITDIEAGAQAADSGEVVQTETGALTYESLQALYDEKLALLTKSEMDNAKRILTNKEAESYEKLSNFLHSKQATE